MAAAARASRKAKAAAPDLTGSALLLCAHGRSGGGAGAPAAGFGRPPSSEDRRATTRAPAAGFVRPLSSEDRRATIRAPAAGFVRPPASEDRRAPEAHAEALRKRRLFACVETCVLHGSPALAEALAGIAVGHVFIVPLLMADGHTFQTVLSEKLAAAGSGAGRSTLCRPVGLSPALAPLAAAEAARICDRQGWPPAETAVVIAGHGTARHERSGVSAALLARRIAALRQFRSVDAAFLDQAPMVAETLRACRPFPCAVLGFFADEGRHSAQDIPRLIAAEHPEAGYSGALGANPAFAEVILAAVREAAEGR